MPLSNVSVTVAPTSPVPEILNGGSELEIPSEIAAITLGVDGAAGAVESTVVSVLVTAA